MNIELSKINKHIEEDSIAYIRKTNEAYEANLKRIADDIADHRNDRPIILLSGPSGSGKTTSALMIEKNLDERGIETHTLSLDNYFKTLSAEEKELFAEGKLDLESPSRIDRDFLTEQLNAIYRCEPVELPEYNFKESERVSSGKILCRKPGELVILEGIHSLNPDIVDFPDERSAKIYVSVRTRITQNGVKLHPSKIRLMRRLVRDMLFRKRSFHDTLMMYESVENGENKYIMPYKHRSNYDVDTFMKYEICAYRSFLIEAFREMKDEPLVKDMLAFLENTTEMDLHILPPESLICEFVGNGQFNS